MSRQSVWPSAPPPSDHLDYLEDCISATEGCVQSLSGALVRLEPGIRDFPRLTKVFTNQHRYLVLPQTTIQTDITTLSRELAPQIDKLLKRADTLLEAERQKLEGIENTIKVLQSTPTPLPVPINISTSTGIRDEEAEGGEGEMWNSKIEGLDMKGLSMGQIKKINLMRNKRKRLEDERVKLGLV